MSSRGFAPLDFVLVPRPASLSRGASSARLSFSASCLRRSNRVGGAAAAASRPILFAGRRGGYGRGIRSASNAGSGPESVATSAGSVEEDPEAAQLFEKLKDAERQRISKLEELERKANVQLERQLVMASSWSRALLTMRGKSKGTKWDPENSHRIDYSDFLGLLNTNNVQFVEYSNYGQTMSVILPYYKDGHRQETQGNSQKEIVFRRHVVDRIARLLE